MWVKVLENPAYEVSDLGGVRRRGTGTELALTPRPNGYVSVLLSGENGKRRFYVHRLVAAAFLGGCPADKQVNHRNFIRHDNRAVNLEVVTCAENAAHSKAAGRYAENRTNAPRGDASCRSKLTAAQVATIRDRVSRGDLKAHLAREFGVSKNQVANIVTGKSWA